MEEQFNFTTNANLVLCVSVKTLTECVLYSQACGGTFEGSHSEEGIQALIGHLNSMILYVCDQVNENKPNFNTHAIDRSAFHSGGMKAHSLAKGHSTHPEQRHAMPMLCSTVLVYFFLCD